MNNATQLRDALAALVDQIEKCDFTDALGHKATMNKAYLDAKRLLKQPSPSRPTAMATSGYVRVCPIKDIVCGDHEANWCSACPKRNRKNRSMYG